MKWPAAEDAVAHVLVDALDDHVEIDGPDGHHLQRVRRLRARERITAGDGHGRWRGYVVVDAPRGRVVAEATGAIEIEPQLVPRVCVAVALTKGGLDTVAARLTQLGVHRIEPVRTLRSVVRWDAERAAAAVARLRVVVREAAGQCRRARLPEVHDIVTLDALVGRAGLVVAERDGVGASELAEPEGGEWTVLVGPEGGFAPEERAKFLGPRLAIGPYVLRAETAPIAASAALIGRTRWSDPV